MRHAAASLVLFTLLAATSNAQTVVDVLPASNGAWGLEYHDGFLWQGNDSDGYVYKIDPADGSVVGTIGTPYDQDTIPFGANHGVAWDGTGLWIAGDFNKDWLYKIDLTGATLDSLATPTDAVGGLSFDGSLLLVTTYFPNETAGIIRFDPVTGTQVGATIPTLGAQPFGVAYDASDGTVWNGMDDNDGDAEIITNYSYPAGVPGASFPTPAGSPKGLCFGGGFMWLVANNATGAGRRIYKIDLGGGGTPDIDAVPTAHDFGIVAIGTTASALQEIMNLGDGDLVVSDVSTSLPFSTDPLSLPLTVSPGKSTGFDVAFTPSAAGTFEDALTVTSNDVDEPTVLVDLTGIGVPADATVSLSPSAVVIPTTGVGLVKDTFVLVENTGFASLDVTAISIDDPRFSVHHDMLPVTLSTFETLSVQVIFAPTAEGAFGGTLTVETSDPASPVSTLSVDGSATVKSYTGGDIIWSASGIENVVDVLELPDVTGEGRPDAVMESYDAGASSGDPHRGYYGNSDGGGVRIWSRGEGGSGGWGEQCLALSGDLDDDGFPEIVRGVAWGGQRVDVVGAEDGELLWSFDTDIWDGGGWVYSVDVLDDVTGDGKNEIVAASGGDGSGGGARRAFCLDGATGALRFALVGIDGFLSVRAGEDVNGDTVADVVAGSGGNSEDTRVFCLSGASTGSATVLWTFDTGGSVWSVDFIEDVNTDGVNDVIAGSWSGSVFCLDGTNGDEIWSMPVGGLVERALVVDDVTGDGIEDVAVAALTSSVRLLNGATGALEWLVPTGDNVWSVDDLPDVDGDGVPEIIAGSQDDNAYCISGASGSVLWSTSLGPLVFSVASIGDVNGNGTPDVLAGTQRLSSAGGDMFCLEGGMPVVAVEEPDVAPTVRFVGFTSNPLRTRGAFVFDLAEVERAALTVDIYDLRGRHVTTLSTSATSGRAELTWDGTDARGRRVASGQYFYRVGGLKEHGSALAALGGKITVLR